MSKALEALKRIEDFMKVNAKHYKQDVEYIEKSIKALEIIKEKQVNVQFFIICAIMIKDYEEYKHMYECEIYKSVTTMSKILLEKEDYDLLKEELL